MTVSVSGGDTRDRYWQCDDTCTVDCGACKGQGRPKGDDTRMRDQLAGLIAAVLHARGCEVDCSGDCQTDAEAAVNDREVLAYLERIADQRAAEALERAYVEDRTTVAKLSPVERLTCYLVKSEDLVVRAAALRGEEIR